MMKVFASGSCRLVTTLHDGRGKIEPIHSMFRNFTGINFLGKLHNTKQHIQFVKWINDDLHIPPHILTAFLTSYGRCNGSRAGMDSEALNPIKKQNIKDSFYHCDVYIFELCSLKLYEKDGYQVQSELTRDYDCGVQSEAELYEDLQLLHALIPAGKPILFQTHFRPNIVYNDPSKTIDNREILYNVVTRYCNAHANAYIYDPSVLLATDRSLFDGATHFKPRGHEQSFMYMYEHFLQSKTGDSANRQESSRRP